MLVLALAGGAVIVLDLKTELLTISNKTGHTTVLPVKHSLLVEIERTFPALVLGWW